MDSLRADSPTLTLVGGPLEALVAWANAARPRFARVAVAPGPGGLDEAAIARLIAARVDALRSTLHAADPAAHDYHAGVEGSARATIAMLRAARAARLPAVVTTPLTRSNARVLAALPGLLADVGAAGWRVLVPETADESRSPGSAQGAMTPRLAVAVPYALQAIVAAGRAGVPAAIEGAPLCLLGPLRGLCLPAPPRAFAPACAGCGAREDCAGIDGEYLRRHDGDELSPRALGPAEGGRRWQGLRDMFWGPCVAVGEGACWPI